jgi:hypothetical protein
VLFALCVDQGLCGLIVPLLNPTKRHTFGWTCCRSRWARGANSSHAADVDAARETAQPSPALSSGTRSRPRTRRCGSRRHAPHDEDAGRRGNPCRAGNKVNFGKDKVRFNVISEPDCADKELDRSQ